MIQITSNVISVFALESNLLIFFMKSVSILKTAAAVFSVAYIEKKTFSSERKIHFIIMLIFSIGKVQIKQSRIGT